MIDLLNRRTDLMQTTLSDYSVGFAANLTLGSMTANIPGAPTNFSGTNSYTHDAKLQLTQETSSRAGGYTNNQVYDSAGNATSFKGVAQTFNSNNQNTANTYDLNGNPTIYKGASCTYNAENQLTSYGSAMTAGYLAGGQRAWKQTSSGTTYFLYADGVIPVCEMDAGGNVIATNTIGERGLLSRRTTSSSFYAFDLQGSASNRLDSSGNTLSTSTFDAYGARVTNDTSGDPYAGFGGQYGYRSDAEAGLQLLGLRYYDPTTGRFATRDPIGYKGGVNVYGYCVNNSIIRIDPLGEATIRSIDPWKFGGFAPGHTWIRLGSPCSAPRNDGGKGPITSIGFWPRDGIWGRGQYNANDPEDGEPGSYPTNFDDSKDFEDALCECIKKALQKQEKGEGPDYRFPFWVCSDGANDLWQCARNGKDKKRNGGKQKAR